ncbi:MAG: FAD-dependent oxidoreductase [Chloroflexi bacterium]|nr:FAD-dependent oxidoreductase [Chloroflexota bacterium]
MRLDPPTRQVHLADGRALHYDRLLLAVGNRAVLTKAPGEELEGVITLDTLDNARDLVRRARKARSAVVVGGGITAMEMVEGLHHNGAHTHYLLRRDLLWSTVFNQAESDRMIQRIRDLSVHVHLNEELDEILGRNGRVTGVRLKSGKHIPCQIVAIGIGVRPKMELLKGAGIQTDRGILTDEYLETSVPGIYAAGDCATVHDRWSGKHLLDSLWPGAVATGRAAGANMAGANQPHIKGSPFNVAQLFGVHITVIGQLATGGREGDAEEIEFLSRGSSEVWMAETGRAYTSAFDEQPDSSVRLVMRDGKLVGALLVGNQSLADALRDLIEYSVPIHSILPRIQQGGDISTQAVLELWRRWRENEPPEPVQRITPGVLQPA